MLQIYNSLTRKKEQLQTLEPNVVKLYVCGNTVYDLCHLGHARSMIGFDVFVRYLRSRNYQVYFVRNITDVDDKIIKRSQERGIAMDDLTNEYINAQNEDTRALNLLTPDSEPRATQSIDIMIDLIERLLAKEYAYINESGDVCFEVAKYKQYGKLSKMDIDELQAGIRAPLSEVKRSPLDFVLWKMSKPGEPAWESPWGLGRPGWHIECSAMAMNALGETFDIHGGGVDLQFPHHENEIAQSECATDKSFANVWMHVGLLQVNHEKMAKSIGNFYTIRDVLKKHHFEVIRYFFLTSHYRSPLNYDEVQLQQSHSALTRLYQSIKGIKLSGTEILDKTWESQFNSAMDDDINTPEALAVLFQLSHEVNKTSSPILAFTLKYLANILGIITLDPDEFLKYGSNEIDTAKIEELIAIRNNARKERDWAKSDEIRETLAVMGVEVEDTARGTEWRRKII